MRVLLINGPKRVGKDTLGRAIVAHCKNPTTIGAFANNLKSMACGMLSRMPDIDGVFKSVQWLDDHKDEKILFGGASWRELIIAVSQGVVKPLFGPAFFGQWSVDQLRFLEQHLNQHQCVIADAGFNAECRPVVEAFGKDNVLGVSLQRPGFSNWEEERKAAEKSGSQPREWLNAVELGIKVYGIEIAPPDGKWLEQVDRFARGFADWLDGKAVAIP